MIQWESLPVEMEYGGAKKCVYRFKVPGGWIVCVRIHAADDASGGLAFYPDPDHKWEGDSIP